MSTPADLVDELLEAFDPLDVDSLRASGDQLREVLELVDAGVVDASGRVRAHLAGVVDALDNLEKFTG